jgi:hypothetical protein
MRSATVDGRGHSLSDWLHGVGTTRYEPHSGADLDGPISPAQRLRLVYEIITGPNMGNDHLHEDHARVKPGHPFPHVLHIFPPHDPAFNRTWLQNWASASSVLSIPRQQLDAVKDQFGEAIALYFEFLRHCTHLRCAAHPPFNASDTDSFQISPVWPSPPSSAFCSGITSWSTAHSIPS